MTKQVIWVKKVLDTFIEEGNLTEIQEKILRMRIEGYSIIRQADELNLTPSKINKEIREMKRKYDEAQKYSNILPPRKINKKDLFKDK